MLRRQTSGRAQQRVASDTGTSQLQIQSVQMAMGDVLAHSSALSEDEPSVPPLNIQQIDSTPVQSSEKAMAVTPITPFSMQST